MAEPGLCPCGGLQSSYSQPHPTLPHALPVSHLRHPPKRQQRTPACANRLPFLPLASLCPLSRPVEGRLWGSGCGQAWFLPVLTLSFIVCQEEQIPSSWCGDGFLTGCLSKAVTGSTFTSHSQSSAEVSLSVNLFCRQFDQLPHGPTKPSVNASLSSLNQRSLCAMVTSEDVCLPTGF